MITSTLLRRMRKMRIVIVFLAMLLAYGAVNYSMQAATPFKTFTIDLGGVTGTANNTALAYGRFVLIAPFAPSNGVDDKGRLELSELDNRFLYVVDAQKPNRAPLQVELTGRGARSVYFPTKILFDPHSSIAYVRGTRFEEKDNFVTAIDVIAYVHVNLDEDGKPEFDTVVPIDIQGVTSDYTNEAPLDFALGPNGDLLVFTNGASIFSYNLDQGYVNRLEKVPAGEYSVDNAISFVDVDQATGVVSVCWNRRTVGDDKSISVSSEISFYQLMKDGTFEFLTRVNRDQFPKGAALAQGSNVAIVSDPDKEDSKVALFVTTDGSLCSVNLHTEDGTGTIEQLHSFPELTQSTTAEASPVRIRYDSATGALGIVRPGFTVQISRPTNGKRGRISRPTNLHITSAGPALVIARLDKEGKVASVSTFVEDFKDQGGLSNFVSGQDSDWLIATYSGNLYSLAIGADLRDSTPQFVASIGSRIDWIDYYADRTSIVAISSFEPGEDGAWVKAPGSLVVGRWSELANGNILHALLPTASVLGKSAPSIRRPCNIKR